jgi:hypothetical protein
VKTVFLALLLTVAVARAQDAATMAAQQAALQAAQQTQQDLMPTGQATLLGLQQIQFDQLVMQQMQVAGGAPRTGTPSVFQRGMTGRSLPGTILIFPSYRESSNPAHWFTSSGGVEIM